MFQNIDAPEYGEFDDMERLVDGLCTGRLLSLIRTRSRSSGEATYVLSGDFGKSTKLLIANFGRREATVIEVKVNMDTLMQTIGNPATAGKAFGVKNAWWDK